MSDKASACPHCGAPYSAAPAVVETKCEECGAVLPNGANICPSCGCPVNAEPGKPAASAQAVSTPPPAVSAPVVSSPAVSALPVGDEQFERVLVEGEKFPGGKIFCTVIAILFWLVSAAAVGLIIYDFHYAQTIGGFLYSGVRTLYYSGFAGEMLMDQRWFIVGLAAAAVLAIIGAVIFIAGLGKRINVTNARVVIKRPFKPTPKLTWDRIESAVKETEASFVVMSGDKKYRVKNLKNQEQVFRIITDMISRKSSGTLNMPAAYGAKSVFGKLLRKKAVVISAAGVVVAAIAAIVLPPVIMKLSAREVTNAAYEWKVKQMLYDGSAFVREITITGCYSGGWLNGKPYGMGTFLSDGGYFPFESGTSYTGTWKNGEPCKGTVVRRNSEEVFNGSFKYGKAHGQCKENPSGNAVLEGKFKYGSLVDGTVTLRNGEVRTYKDGREVT